MTSKRFDTWYLKIVLDVLQKKIKALREQIGRLSPNVEIICHFIKTLTSCIFYCVLVLSLADYLKMFVFYRAGKMPVYNGTRS